MDAGYSLRCLMLYVAAIALCMAGADYFTLYSFCNAECRALAAHHAYEARLVDKQLKAAKSPELQSWMIRSLRYHQRLEAEYRAVSSRPFWKRLGQPPDESGMPERIDEKDLERSLP